MLEICNFGKSFSTRKYKKTHLHHYRSPRKKLETQEEKSAPQENNKVIEDPEMKSRPQTGAQISINTGLAHFIWTGQTILLYAVSARNLQLQLCYFTISWFWLSWRVRHTWRNSCLVILGHLIEVIGLGDAILGEDILCMVFWLLMVMYW